MGLPKNEIMTVEQMDAMNYEILDNSRLYSKDTDNSEKVSMSVNAITQQLIDAPMKKISLNDYNTVRAVTVEYMKSCSRTGIIPSKTGLSRALGITRAAADAFIKRNPGSDTARFLSMAFDAFAEMLSANSLAGSVHPIVSIFLQKALYGYRDNEPLTIAEEPEERVNIDGIMERWKFLPD